jgi:hypothetical protein
MTSVLIELADRRNRAVRLDPVQVELSFSPGDMAQYLNSMLLQEKSYRFYINNRLLRASLGEAVRAKSLEIERVFTIEYETDEEDKPDVSLRLDDTVAFMRIALEASGVYSLYCSTYGGTVKIYRVGDGRLSLLEDTACIGVRGAAREDDGKLYMYNASGEIVSYGIHGVLFDVPSEAVTCIAASEGRIAVGTDRGACYLYIQDACMVCRLNQEITSVFFRGHQVRFTSLDGKYVLHDICTGTTEIREMEYKCTSMDSGDGVILYGTANSRLVADDGEERVLVSSTRYINKIAIHSNLRAAIASQYIASILDLRSGDEMKRIAVGGQIADMGWAGNMLFIAHGPHVSGYAIPASVLLD